MKYNIQEEIQKLVKEYAPKGDNGVFEVELNILVAKAEREQINKNL